MSRVLRVVGEPDAVALGIVEVDRPARAVHDEDAGGLQAVLPGAPLPGGDAQRDEVEPGLAVAPRPRRRRLLGALEGEEARALAVDGQPDAAIAPLLARPAPQHRQA